MNYSEIWLLAGLALAIVVCGGVLGTILALKHTRGPLERAFVIRACVVCWMGGILSVAGLVFIPAPWKFGIAILYLVKIATSFLRWRRRRLELRAEDTAAL